MSESRPSENGGADGIPPWMTTVEEETFYNASPTDQTNEAPSSSASPTAPGTKSASVAPSGDRGADKSETSLHQKLSMTMEQASELPEPDPNLQPTVVGRVRADLNRQLEKAVSVLNTRYAEDIPKSLLLEFSIRRILVDLQERDEGSTLVQWLDSVLSRL